MLQFSLSYNQTDKNDNKLVVTNKYDDTSVRQVYGSTCYPELGRNIKIFSDINNVFQYLSIYETEAIFTFYEDMKMRLVQNHRKDELNALYDYIGKSMLTLVDKIRFIDVCEKISSGRSGSVQFCESYVSFVTIAQIFKIMLPILICVRNKSRQYSDNRIINDIAVSKVMRPIIDSYFERIRIVIKKWIGYNIDQLEEVIKQRKDGINNKNLFTEMVYSHILNTSFLCERTTEGIIIDMTDRLDGELESLRNYQLAR